MLHPRIYFVLLLCFFSLYTNAQQEAAIWYFGEAAGLDFNSGVPVPLTDGALVTQEGCASIADATGNLLFYTDGSTIWNRNHAQMPNGNRLRGHPSSTQSAIIVPSPGNPNIYYVFTVFVQGNPGGLRYNIVDMTLDGGLGDVTLKDVPLENRVLEKVTAVQHGNGTDIWVVAHRYGNDEFVAYQITPTGLNPAPVVSAVGVSHPFMTNGRGTRGYMKASPDGQFLALATSGTFHTEVFRFDPFSGIVSDGLLLDDYFAPIPQFTYHVVYGAEFSSDSSKLYIGYTFYPDGTTEISSIHQFDMSAYDQATMIATGIEIAPPQNVEMGAFQLAIDGKIYVAQFGESYMGAINNPNVLGTAADYVQNAVSLLGRNNRLGLPPFIQSFFIVGLRAQNFCLGDGTEFSVTASDPITSILWDFGDGTTSTLENPTHTYAATGTYTVNATVNTATETKTETKEITIYDTPTAASPGDLLGCTSYGSYNVDLPSFNPAVIGAQDPTDVTVAYFLSQQDADNNTNALDPIHEFAYGTTPVFVRVSNANASLCYSTAQFNIIAREAPIVGDIADWTVCDDDADGLFTFDLALKANEIFNGQDATKFELFYYSSQADADADSNALPLNYTNTATTEEIFFRFQNSTYPTCYRTGSFMIEVLQGVTANTPSDLSFCDDNNDGQAVFDLTQATSEIIGAQNPASLAITYHASQTDADANVNVLPTDYQSTDYQTTIFVRAANTSDVSCYDTTSFQLNIFDTPVVPQVADWQVCDDDNDQLFSFDLNEKNAEIQNGLTNIELRYYESQQDAELDQNPIVGVWQNTANPQTVYFRLENGNNADCFGVGSFTVQVFDTPIAGQPDPIVICDVDETGLYTFDLSVQDATIRNGQDAAFYSVSYHASELDAMNNANALSKNSYQNTVETETIYARMQHRSLDICYDVTSFQLIVNPLPQIPIEDQYVICPDSPDLVVNGGTFESYEWRDATNALLSTAPTLPITQLGTYELTVTETTNGVTCTNTKSFTVVSSGAPETLQVDSSGFSDTVTLIVQATGIGTFEYSIDGENYQTDNVFDVFPGTYTVYVRDPFECRTLTDTFFAMGYRKFFTPNGDDTHEFWNVIGAENMPNASVTIYDRYGKLLRQLAANGSGWDGTYLGNPLPAADYWFRFDDGNGQQMTGHFTLKR
ncbi:T9SS type B sorting domain-containing protein [uncultured Croceitalea sp.]|uniref:T9SS type B sorting domain-containing protein n=1 Tax=uncultured Croceitalea sp. TaxID=1798908 RepID=UPI0033063853